MNCKDYKLRPTAHSSMRFEMNDYDDYTKLIILWANSCSITARDEVHQISCFFGFMIVLGLYVSTDFFIANDDITSLVRFMYEDWSSSYDMMCRLLIPCEACGKRTLVTWYACVLYYLRGSYTKGMLKQFPSIHLVWRDVQIWKHTRHLYYASQRYRICSRKRWDLGTEQEILILFKRLSSPQQNLLHLHMIQVIGFSLNNLINISIVN